MTHSYTHTQTPHKWVEWKPAQFTLSRCTVEIRCSLLGMGERHPIKSKAEQFNAMQVRKWEKMCAAKLGNCIKWLYFDTLWLGFQFFMFISIHAAPSLSLCFYASIFFALLGSVLHCRSVCGHASLPCWSIEYIITSGTHFFRHSQYNSLLVCTRKILALIYTIHFENWILCK